MDSVLQELVKAAPFGVFAIICLILLSRHYKNAIDVISDINNKSIAEIRNAYKNANKYKNLNK